jgi:hypothetical protein
MDENLDPDDDPLFKVKEAARAMSRSLAMNPDPDAQLARDVSICILSHLSQIEKRLELGMPDEDLKVMMEIDLVEVEQKINRLNDSLEGKGRPDEPD